MLLIVFLFLFSAVAGAQMCSVGDSAKKDCGYVGITEEECLSKSCCWNPSDNSEVPWCYRMGTDMQTTYKLADLEETSTGMKGKLTLNSGGTTTFGEDIETLEFNLLFEGEDYVRFKIKDAGNVRWEVPYSIVDRPHDVPAVSEASRLYTVDISESPFSLTVKRKSDGTVILQTDETLVFKDQYLQLTVNVDPAAKTYGLGESTRLNHALESGETYTLFNVDIPAQAFYNNLYGAFPFYLQHVRDQVHGVMLYNSNGMDVSLEDSTVTFKAIGGIMDVYAFVGPSGDDVVSQYTSVVGRPMMVPYWSLGFHNCKYGYTDVWQVEDVVEKYEEAGIPLDTQWMDIDYMDEYRDFTTDPEKYPYAEVESFIGGLHKNGQHFVQIIDPGIEPKEDYSSYTRGKDLDIFIKDVTGKDFLGQVWPGPAVFPDFLHPSIEEYWSKEISDYHAKVAVDGLWIDMNEVSNFCNNAGTEQTCTNSAPSGCPAPGASQTECCLVCATVDSMNNLDFPPYEISNSMGKLNTKTMTMSSVQYGNVSHYDSHNLYGLTEAIFTNKALTEVRKERPYLLSRSSFAGSGKFTTKWTGDNAATWDDLKSSIISMMDFNFFGIPMIGADICGFNGPSNEELCARWIEVGAFSPFSRNHNALGQPDQELYLWDSVTEASKRALGMRYRMLPYMYSLFHKSHTKGSTVMRPLWFNFLDDAGSATIDRQYMLGDAVLLSPVLDEGQTSVSAYFPAGMWYNFETSSFDFKSEGETKTIDTPLEATNVHIRGGNVLPLQDPAMTTTAGRKTPFTFLAALCESGNASGDLFWDDGVQIELDESIRLSFTAQATDSTGSFTSVVDESTFTTDNVIGSIVVLGQNLALPTNVYMDGKKVDVEASFDASKGALTFAVGQLPLAQGFTLTWD